jgi:hypothetical protein
VLEKADGDLIHDRSLELGNMLMPPDLLTGIGSLDGDVLLELERILVAYEADAPEE